MSDFLCSNTPRVEGQLGECIRSIYHTDAPDVEQYSGGWGSLAVSRSLHKGLQPLETEQHIVVIIGGPVLCFRDNRFLTGNDPTAGTRAIYRRYLRGDMEWDEDLSGPFVVLIIDKRQKKITYVTDLMMFIPVYRYEQNGDITVGTHVDAVASASGKSDNYDLTSIVDFIAHGVVTYPYTFYKNIKQAHPAAIHRIEKSGESWHIKSPSTYWLPVEKYRYPNLNEAAQALRDGLLNYVGRVTESMDRVGQFLSGGEDSRAVAGMLAKTGVEREGFVFLDNMNREGRIAARAAEAYDVNFHPVFRSKTHYLDILPEAADLVGSGSQYTHAHSLRLSKQCAFDAFPAVFGGFLSDGLVKGLMVRKLKLLDRFPFYFQIQSANIFEALHNNCKRIDQIYEGVCRQVKERRREHLCYLHSIRPNSAVEWFNLWPITMDTHLVYHHVNRRLFRSYEPFMCKQVVRIAAASTTRWKLNRRLFRKATAPFQKPARDIPHSDGYYPYFPWWINSAVRCHKKIKRKVRRAIGFHKGHQGPWADWSRVMQSDAWDANIKRYSEGFGKLQSVTEAKTLEQLIKSDALGRSQRINLLQTLYHLC